MEVAFFKFFLSKRKEMIWLNKLGQSGHLLKKVNDSKYYFEKSDTEKYHYFIEHLKFSPRSDDAEEYFDSLSEINVTPVVYDKNWVYFVSSDEKYEPGRASFMNNANFHLVKLLYYFFFAVCGAVLCGYHAYSIDFLIRIGEAGDGRITKIISLSRSSNALYAVLNLFKRMCNYLIKLTNGYFKIWTNIFGEYEPIAVLSVAIPITVLLLIVGAVHLDEYISYRLEANKLNKSLSEDKESESNDAEQGI